MEEPVARNRRQEHRQRHPLAQDGRRPVAFGNSAQDPRHQAEPRKGQLIVAEGPLVAGAAVEMVEHVAVECGGCQAPELGDVHRLVLSLLAYPSVTFLGLRP